MKLILIAVLLLGCSTLKDLKIQDAVSTIKNEKICYEVPDGFLGLKVKEICETDLKKYEGALVLFPDKMQEIFNVLIERLKKEAEKNKPE